tara:strand:+ start:8191 stop:8859 length:669 start_codon:yes stop_codon:yes gene_type:complete
MNTLVIAPHADDEILGCGGTLLRKIDEGHTVGLIIVTSMKENEGWNEKAINKRKKEILKIQKELKIKKEHLYQLDLPSTKLDTLPLEKIVKKISEVFNLFHPEELFLPHPGDAHSDHRVSFEASISCTKWFRFNCLKKIFTYETISETDASLNSFLPFTPNTFIDVSKTIDRKCDLMKIYESEIKDFPFPRSEEAIKALAKYRGSQSGYMAAEAFCLLRERR